MSEATQPQPIRPPAPLELIQTALVAGVWHRMATQQGRQPWPDDASATSASADIPLAWSTPLRSGPGGPHPFTVGVIRMTLFIADHGLPPDAALELTALKKLIAVVEEVLGRPYAPDQIAALPAQIALAHWEDEHGRPITVYAFRRRTRPGRLGMSSVFPLAGLAGAKVALALAGAAVVIAGVATFPPGNGTSLIPARPETAAVREHYVAPAPTRDAVGASAPEPQHRDPADAPTPTPTAYAGQIPAGPTATPTPTLTALPTVVPPTVLPSVLALASP